MKEIARKLLNTKVLEVFSKIFHPIYSGRGSILMFHRVVPTKIDLISRDIEVTVEYLENIILYFLDLDYDIISIADINTYLEKDKRNKFVVFTFDDGYIDNYELVYPLFKKYNVPFTIYISTSFPDKTAFLWWYPLYDLVKNNKIIEFKINNIKYTFEVNNSNSIDVYSKIRRLFLDLESNSQNKVIKNIFDKYSINYAKYSEQLTMDWDMIEELVNDDLVTIGAHTINHRNLKKLSLQDAYVEINNSKLRLERKLGVKIEHFAYPFGSQLEADMREFELVKEIGFESGVTTRTGNIFTDHLNRKNALPRISPNPRAESSLPALYTNGMIPALRNKFRKII